MKISQRLLYFVTLFVPLSSYADLTPAQQQIRLAPQFQCQFTQTRHLKEMKLQLQSMGTFILDQKKGIIWQQTTPFPQTIVMTDKRIYQSVLGNVQIISAADQPQLFHFTHLMGDVLQGKWQNLNAYFHLEDIPVDQQQWQIKLTPNKAPFQHIFQHITLTGDANIHTVVLEDKQGDSTHLRFKHCQALKTLNHEQETLFAQ